MEEGQKKIAKKQRVMVVKELPTQPVTSFTEKGVEYRIITIEEALTELLNK